MTPTNEDLLALAKIICAAMNGPSEYGWDDQSDLYRGRCLDAARCAIVAERQAIRDKALEDAAQAASNRAAYFRDAAETASEAGFHALRAFHAMRELCLVEIAAAIRAMKGKPE